MLRSDVLSRSHLPLSISGKQVRLSPLFAGGGNQGTDMLSDAVKVS